MADSDWIDIPLEAIGTDSSSQLMAASSTNDGDWVDVPIDSLSSALKPQGFWANVADRVKHPLDTISQSAQGFYEGASKLKSLLPTSFTGIPTTMEEANGPTLSDIEQGVRFLGSNASGLAGASLGAQMGAPLAPFTAGLSIPAGALVGGGLGLLGFDKANQFTGSDAPTNYDEDLNRLGQNIGAGLVLTPALKAASASGSIFSAPKSLMALTPKGRAATLLEKAGGESIRAIVENPNDPFFKTRTLAEETQNPQIAQLQDSVSKRVEKANDALVLNEGVRRATQENLFNKLSTESVKPLETSGEQLRNILDKASQEAFTGAGNLLESVDQGAKIPFSKLRTKLSSILGEEYKAGGVPSNLASIVSEANKVMQLGEVKAKPKYQSFDYIVDLRERAQQAWADAKLAGDAKQARIAQKMIRSIDSAMESGTTKGTLSPEDLSLFREGNKQYSQATDIYKSGKLGGTLFKMKEGAYMSKASQAVGKYFDGTPEGTKQLLRALPEGAENLEVARGAIRDFIREKTITNDEIFAPEKFRTFLRENKAALTAEHNGKRLYTPEHIKNIEMIAEDLGYLSPQSQTSVKGLATRASKGQSSTAQALLSDIGRELPSKIFGLKTIANAYNNAVNEILTEALIKDKTFAQELVKPATPSSVSRARSVLGGSETSALAQANYGFRTPQEQSQREESKIPIPLLNSAPNFEANQDPIDRAFNMLISGVKNKSNKPESFGPEWVDKAFGQLVGGGDMAIDSKPQVQVPEEAFDSKVQDIAKNLGTDPEHLYAVMNFETGGTLDSAQKNRAGSGATGLIQFMPETAKDLTGASSKEAAIELMSSMSPVEQLDYVEKYLKPFKGKIKSLDDMYMAVLYPKAVGKDPNYTLFKKGTKAYWQNRGLDLDKDGIITKMEAANKVSSYKV